MDIGKMQSGLQDSNFFLFWVLGRGEWSERVWIISQSYGMKFAVCLVNTPLMPIQRGMTISGPICNKQILSLGSWQNTGLIDAKTGTKFSYLCTFNFRFTDAISQCCRSGMFIPDPRSEFFPSRIPDHRSEVFPSRIPDPGSASMNLSILTQKNGF